jgi:tRNA 2-selenouridine synthase SelU
VDTLNTTHFPRTQRLQEEAVEAAMHQDLYRAGLARHYSECAAHAHHHFLAGRVSRRTWQKYAAMAAKYRRELLDAAGIEDCGTPLHLIEG